MHRHGAGCFVHTFPFSALYNDMLAMLIHMSMHESCLLVCCPCFNIKKSWKFDPNLYLSLVDTIFCFLFCLFAVFPVCLLSHLFALLFVRLHPCFYACHVYHAYLLYASFIHFLHIFLPLLVCWFLVFAFACTHTERGCMELGHGLLGASKKGTSASMSV